MSNGQSKSEYIFEGGPSIYIYIYILYTTYIYYIQRLHIYIYIYIHIYVASGLEVLQADDPNPQTLR